MNCDNIQCGNVVCDIRRELFLNIIYSSLTIQSSVGAVTAGYEADAADINLGKHLKYTFSIQRQQRMLIQYV